MYIGTMGFSKKEISIAVTINTLSSLIGQNLIGYLVDKLKKIKLIFIICISMGIVVALGLSLANYTWQIYILIAIWGFFLYGTVPLSEAWCIELLKINNQQRNFGRIRGFGSVGYGLSGIFIGLYLQKLGWGFYPWYILVSVVLTLICVWNIKSVTFEYNKAEEEAVETKISYKQALKEIIKIKPIMTMIAIIFMYNFVLKGIYSYLGVMVADYGGGPLSLGFTYFFDAAPEVITFFLAAPLLKKYKSQRLILIAFFLQIVRLSLILVFNNALAIIVLGILSGFAFGLLASAYKTYIYERAPEKYKASCMSLSESIIGFSAVISAPVFGFLFTFFGTRKTIFIGLIINFIIVFFVMKNYLNSKIKTI